MTDSTRFEEARKWVDSLEPRWRLQILSKRFRIDKDSGEKIVQPTRIRRFVEGVPWALVHDSVDYLLSKAPYSGIVYNGVGIPGTYRPTLTTWSRDDKDETVSKTSIKTNDGTYTLIQDLIEDGIADAYEASTSGSCSEEVVTEWHWDAAGVDPIPSASQGVTYAIQAVSRKDDGTFDYALVKRTAKTQHMPRTVQSDDAVQHVEIETWDNAYGDPESGLTYDDGSPIELPSKTHVPGSRVEFQYSENSDCTFRVSAVTTTSKSSKSRTSSEKDQFSEKSSETVSGQLTRLDDAPAPSDGHITRHESQLRPDGTFDNTVSVEDEMPVQESSVEMSSNRRGVRRTVTSRNQSAPVPTSDLAIGDSVRIEKTPGKLYNNTVSSWIRSALMKVADVCRVDRFSHRHSETQAGLSEIPTGDVDGGSGGIVRTRTTQMDDEGSISEVTEVETEKEVVAARESWTYGLFGRRHRVESRSVSERVDPPVASKETVGKTVVNEITPGGLFNTVVEDIDRTADPVQDGSSCEKTVFEHTDSSSTRNPDGSLPEHVDDAGGGKRHTVSGSLNEDGSSTVRETVVEEKKYEGATVAYRRTAKAFFKQTTDKNVSETAQRPEKVGFSESHTTNPGGTHDLTKTTVEPTGCVDRAHSADDVFTSESDEVTVKTDVYDVDKTPCTASGGGKTYRKEAVLDDDGVMTVTERKTEEKKYDEAAVTYRRTAKAFFKQTTDKNVNVTAQKPEKVGFSESHTTNPGGTHDLTKTTVELTGCVDRAHSADDVFTSEHDEVTVKTDSADVDKTPCQTSGGGKTYRKDAVLDDDGVMTITERETTEKEFSEASVSYRRTAKAFFKQTTDKNVGATAQKPEKVGFSESHTTNPGGTHDLTKTTVELTGCVDRAHSADDAFSSEKDTVTVKTDVSDVDQTPCTESGNGKFYRKDAVLDDDGIMTVTERETTEKTVTSADKVVEKKPRGIVTTVTDKSSEGDPSVGGTTVMSRASVTQGGKKDITTKIASDPTADSAYAHEDAFESVIDSVVVSAGGAPSANATGGNGSVQTTTSEVDSDGFVKTVTRTSTGKQFQYQSGAYADGTCNGTTTTVRGMSAATYASRIPGQVTNVRSSKLQNGLYETVTETTYAGPPTTWSAESGRGVFRFYTFGFFNQPTGSFSSLLNGAVSKADAWASDTINDIPCDHISLSVSVSMNKFGYLDGSFTVQARWPGTVKMYGKSETIDYEIKDVKITPLYRQEEDESGNVVYKVKRQEETMVKKCRFCCGYGVSSLKSELNKNTLYPGSGFHYNGRDGTWSATIILDEKWECEYKDVEDTISLESAGGDY